MQNEILKKIIEKELWMLALSRREQRVLELRKKNHRTLKSIGLELGVTQERVRQIEARAKQKQKFKQMVVEELNKRIKVYLKEKNVQT